MAARLPSWKCPQCERTVPGREPICYCGVKRSEAPPAWRGEAEERPARGVSPMLALALMVVGGLGVYFAMRTSAPRAPAAGPEAPVEASPAGAEPSGVRRPAARPSAETRETTTTVPITLLPAPRPAAAPTAAARPMPATVETSPSPTAMEEAWTRASALLDPTLSGLGAATTAVEQECAAFASACLSSPAQTCLLSMKTAPIITGSAFGGQARVDCDGERARLITRADGVKARFDEAERLSRVSAVLPGHWRRLLAEHGLEVWERY